MRDRTRSACRCPTPRCSRSSPRWPSAQVLPLSLGGLGIREGMLVLLLHPLGVPTGQGDRRRPALVRHDAAGEPARCAGVRGRPPPRLRQRRRRPRRPRCSGDGTFAHAMSALDTGEPSRRATARTASPPPPRRAASPRRPPPVLVGGDPRRRRVLPRLLGGPEPQPRQRARGVRARARAHRPAEGARHVLGGADPELGARLPAADPRSPTTSTARCTSSPPAA